MFSHFNSLPLNTVRIVNAGNKLLLHVYTTTVRLFSMMAKYEDKVSTMLKHFTVSNQFVVV